jgi:biopolymer transport protein ExbB/TolQ
MVSDLNKKAMVSGLKWQFGFGWGSVSFFVAFVAVSLASSGIVRWIALVITIFALAFLVVQYKNWNTKGWRQVHGRAMQLYAPIAGKEMGNAKRANRAFSHLQAFRRAEN